MAARAQRTDGSGSGRAAVRLLTPAVVPLSVAESEALVEVLALALVPLLVGGEGARRGSGLAEDGDGEGGEPGAGGNLLSGLN
jgi:hypothetical protein